MTLARVRICAVQFGFDRYNLRRGISAAHGCNKIAVCEVQTLWMTAFCHIPQVAQGMMQQTESSCHDTCHQLRDM